MKRFYKQATLDPAEGGHRILLDGRQVKTPARAALALPTLALAEAVAAEWNAQDEEVDPRTMPFTGLANAAIERIAPDRESFVRGLALFGESDLLCYRAEAPAALVARQSEVWDPFLAWARRRYDVNFEVVAGIMHRPQPAHTIEQLAQAVAPRDAFRLAGLAPLVTIAGSLVIALALVEEAVDLDTAWNAASLDEQWQIEQWGEDAEAAARLANRRAEFAAGYEFLKLL